MLRHQDVAQTAAFAVCGSALAARVVCGRSYSGSRIGKQTHFTRARFTASAMQLKVGLSKFSALFPNGKMLIGEKPRRSRDTANAIAREEPRTSKSGGPRYLLCFRVGHPALG
jgi:hypothetical protein